MKIEIIGFISGHNRKIPAIKMMRDATRVGETFMRLREAKDIVDTGRGIIEVTNAALWRKEANQYFRWIPADYPSEFVNRIQEFADDYKIGNDCGDKVVTVTITARGDNSYSAVANLKIIFDSILNIQEEK